jgi:hypothetical protein
VGRQEEEEGKEEEEEDGSTVCVRMFMNIIRNNERKD